MSWRRFATASWMIMGLATGLSILPAQAQVTIGPHGPVSPKRPGPSAANPVPGPRIFASYTVTMPTKPRPMTGADALWPRQRDFTHGNSVPYWYRAVSGVEERISSPEMRQSAQSLSGPDNENWLEMPLESLPIKEVRTFLATFAGNYEAAQTAAQRQTTDWDLQIGDILGMPAIEYRLKEFQEMRTLARLFKLQTRVALHDRNFDEALKWIKLSFRMADAIDSDSVIICDLVGIACASVAQSSLAELITQPEAPALYWSLAGLPEQLVDMRDAVDAELTLFHRLFPWFASAEQVPRDSAGWRGDFRQTMRNMTQLTSDSSSSLAKAQDWQVDTALLAKLWTGYPMAVRELANSGMTADQLEALPVGQAVALQQHRSTERASEEILRFSRRNDPAMVALLGRALPKILEQAAATQIFSADDLFPSTTQALRAESRPVIRHRALMVVEAVRLHASEHQGALPASLAEITAVPVPKHPITGEHFPYQVTAEGAVLDVLTGVPQDDVILMRFELKAGRP